MALAHKGTVMLRTRRLLLRRFMPGDEEAMFANWTSDPNVAAFMRWAPHASLEEAKELLADILPQYETPNFYRWGITIEETGELTGILALMPVSESDSCYDVAYCLGRPWQGWGFATEALTAVLAFAFTEVGINRVEAYHSVNNPASGRVLAKAGLAKEGFSPQKYRCSLGFQDCDLYGVTREAWMKARKAAAMDKLIFGKDRKED